MAIFRQVVLILNVKDVAAQHSLLRKAVSARLDWKNRPRSAACNRTASRCTSKDGQGSPGTWMAIWVDDVDRLHEDLATAGVDIRQRPTTFAWGYGR